MKSLMLAAIALLPVSTLACNSEEAPVFSCMTTTGKSVQVCQAADEIRYAFGRPAQVPEMQLAVPNSSFVWNADGGSAMDTFDLHFDNAATRYTVSTTSFRGDPELSADVLVRQGERQIATLHCKAPSIRFDERVIKAERTPY